MKKVPQIMRLFVLCILVSNSFYSCEIEELSETQTSQTLENEDLYSRRPNTVKVISAVSVFNPNATLIAYTDCNSVCLEEGIETYYKKSGSDTRSAGPNAKLVSYVAYNTATQFIVDVSYAITSGSSGANAGITITIDGDALVLTGIPSGSTVSHAIDLPEDWKACDEIPFSILQSGLSTNITFNSSYALIGFCNQSCEESFSYEENQDGSYTFTYISAEDLTNAVVKFTNPHIVSFEALDGKIYGVNPGKRRGSPTVLSWTGDIEACTPLTFTLMFEADCTQNSGDFANIFTDFKVNEVSKKGSNPNIRFECSSN